MDDPYPNPKPVAPRRGIIAAVVFFLAGLLQLALMSLKDETPEHDDDTTGMNGHRRVEVPAELPELSPREKRKTPVSPS